VDKKNICVLGAGGWGTTLAILLYGKEYRVTLWEKFEAYAKVLEGKRENIKFLPGIKIPEGISISHDLPRVLDKVELIVIAVPSFAVREICRSLGREDINKDTFLVCCSKGLELSSNKRLSEIIQEELPENKLAVLSGPSHAEEVSRGVPTSVVVASRSLKITEVIQNIFMTGRFRVYTSPDVIGVEVGGALKNIVALAAGISDGLGYGDNTKAALLTRGVVEVRKLGVALGAEADTFNGLSGIGDLIATCISPYSRNRQLGEQIGRGKTLKEVLAKTEMVVEGVNASRVAYELSRKMGVEMPITSEIKAVLFEGKSPNQAVKDLMTRRAKPEKE